MTGKKKNSLLVLLICLCLIAGTPGFAQKKERIKVNGEFVAYDKLAPLFDISFAPKSQTFILKVEKVLKGNEPETYLIVVHKTFDSENRILKKILNETKNKVKLKLTRENVCDADLKTLQNVKVEGKPLSQGLPRIEWIDNILTKPDAIMPCYALNDVDIISIK